MNFNHLKDMSREQLVELAGKQNIKIHHKAKPETIIKHIMESTLVKQAPQEMKHVGAAPQKAVHNNSVEDIEAAIAHVKARAPQFTADYDTAENTWHFRCRGAEECGNMAIPLRVIKMKAENVSHGRRAPIALNKQFDDINVSGNSAYTNIVLS